jgi:hypothetical protein
MKPRLPDIELYAGAVLTLILAIIISENFGHDNVPYIAAICIYGVFLGYVACRQDERRRRHRIATGRGKEILQQFYDRGRIKGQHEVLTEAAQIVHETRRQAQEDQGK